jgi:hypothetical protein
MSRYHALRIRLMSTMPSSAIPNLHLKWRAFREIIGHSKTDAEIGEDIFGSEGGAIRFSKLLHGDAGCPPEIAAAFTDQLNKRIEGYCQARAIPQSADKLTGSDLKLPLFAFTRRVIEAAQTVQPEALDRAHSALFNEICARPIAQDAGPQLVVERVMKTRSFQPFKPSGGAGPVIFDAGKDKGELAVIDVSKPPAAVYTFLAFDPSPKRMWDLEWGETVEWLPSPTKPVPSGGRLLLMPASTLKPKSGRYIVTAALSWREDATIELDPKGEPASPRVLDERETSRFIVNLRRLVEDKRGKWAGALTVTSAEYFVR